MSIFHSIIKRPEVTEKNTNLRAKENKYVFEVATDATKPIIRKAVEHLFNVKVESVNTMIVRGKEKRMGRYSGVRSNWKKAIVKLQKGQTISKFEGV